MIGNVELLGQRLGNLILGNKRIIHQHRAELASAALLLVEREHELFLRNEILLYQQIAEANFLRTRHNIFPEFVMFLQLIPRKLAAFYTADKDYGFKFICLM